MMQSRNSIIFKTKEEARRLYDALVNQPDSKEADDLIDEFTDLLQQIFGIQEKENPGEEGQ